MFTMALLTQNPRPPVDKLNSCCQSLVPHFSLLTPMPILSQASAWLPAPSFQSTHPLSMGFLVHSFRPAWSLPPSREQPVAAKAPLATMFLCFDDFAKRLVVRHLHTESYTSSDSPASPLSSESSNEPTHPFGQSW
jgi:hypothetical protein